MTNDSLYVVAYTTDYQDKYEYYIAKGYVNRGVPRFSNDNTKVLVEESTTMFEEEDLQKALFAGDINEIKQYLADNSAEWTKEE